MIRLNIAKSGFTLIEMVFSLSIFSIIMSVFVHLFMSVTIDFNNVIKETRENYYLNETFRYIEVDLSEDAKDIEVLNNRIVVKKIDHRNPDSSPIHYIELEEDRLVIKYSKYGNIIATNNILKNVEQFSVSKSGKLIFLRIKLKRGKMVERCLGARYAIH
jgi:prepilin-type N-terminal cleavage/methylation domain-containing protein